MGVHDQLLPGFEGDPAVVLLAGAVLWEEAGPVLAPAGDVLAALSLESEDLVVRSGDLYGLGAGVDETWPGVIAGDAEKVHPAPGRADPAVPEVEPQ
ncbi:hypothetical protein SCMC78_57820 [Streptomyces sp. CMC78]|uniref:Uncharacterized protein n=1 Tax=Streptomyces sp. CMC78 TaxID=3231512 RepID=A0AB33KW16_9ACTN